MDIFREKNIYFSSIGKFTLGILFAGIGFMMMTFASQNLINNNGLPISMAWIIISIFFLTLGELCVSPIGLSIMAKVAPDLIKNQIMGLWFVASALGNFIAGLIGGNVNIKNIDQLPNIFGQYMWMLFVVALLLFIAKKPIYKILNEKISNYLAKLKIQNTPKLKIDLNISFFIFAKK